MKNRRKVIAFFGSGKPREQGRLVIEPGSGALLLGPSVNPEFKQWRLLGSGKRRASSDFLLWAALRGALAAGAETKAPAPVAAQDHLKQSGTSENPLDEK